MINLLYIVLEVLHIKIKLLKCLEILIMINYKLLQINNKKDN